MMVGHTQTVNKRQPRDVQSSCECTEYMSRAAKKGLLINVVVGWVPGILL